MTEYLYNLWLEFENIGLNEVRQTDSDKCAIEKKYHICSWQAGNEGRREWKWLAQIKN